jgi:hypothetical protein
MVSGRDSHVGDTIVGVTFFLFLIPKHLMTDGVQNRANT